MRQIYGRIDEPNAAYTVPIYFGYTDSMCKIGTNLHFNKNMT